MPCGTYGRWPAPYILKAAAAWIEPSKDKLLDSQAVEVINDLDGVLKSLRGPRRKAVQVERNYLENTRERLDYRGAKERGEPLGSGAWNPPANNTMSDSTGRASFGPRWAMRRRCAWEPSGETGVGRCPSPKVPSDFDPSKN